MGPGANNRNFCAQKLHGKSGLLVPKRTPRSSSANLMNPGKGLPRNLRKVVSICGFLLFWESSCPAVLGEMQSLLSYSTCVTSGQGHARSFGNELTAYANSIPWRRPKTRYESWRRHPNYSLVSQPITIHSLCASFGT